MSIDNGLRPALIDAADALELARIYYQATFAAFTRAGREFDAAAAHLEQLLMEVQT